MKVSIFQWNVLYKEDIRNIAGFLKKTNPDIACLQELTIDNPKQHVQNTVEYIAKELGYNYANEIITFEDDRLKLSNAIYSRFPISSKHNAWINEPTGTNHYDDEYRAYVEATLDVNGHELTVATVHMSYTNAFKVTDRKLKETDRLLEQIKDFKKNFVITGDFNAEPDSEVIKRVSQYLVNAGPDKSQKSWTTKPFSYDGFEANTLDWRLDYIFVTPDIKINSAEILKTEYSDHLPILATLELN